MASIVHIPFNFAPINTGSTTSTYTVPSGKYARVLFSITSRTWIVPSTGNTDPNANCSDSNTVTGDIWLMSGDVVAMSSTIASGTFTNPSGAGATISATGSSSTRLTVNSSEASRVESMVSFLFLSASSTPAVSLDGSASMSIFFQEYNNIS